MRNVLVTFFSVRVCYVCFFGRDEVINKSRKSDKYLVYWVKSFPTPECHIQKSAEM